MVDLLIAVLLFLGDSSMDPSRASQHAQSALAAQWIHDVPATLLLAQARIESRYLPTALSYRECVKGVCKRRTRQWASREKPPHARPSWYCGVLQVGGHVSWEQCMAIRDDVPGSYMKAACHIQQWRDYAPCKYKREPARTNCALRGYGGGWKGVAKKSTRYQRAVRAWQHRIHRTMRVTRAEAQS